MSAKDDLLSDLIRSDMTGGVERINQRLIVLGFKCRGAKNSQTLLYVFRSGGKDIGIAALRDGIFSFPVGFWGSRRAVLQITLNGFKSRHQIALQSGISSSQYSAGQIAIKSDSIEPILQVISTMILSEAKQAGASVN